MMSKDERLLADLEVRMRQLMYYCDSLKEENARLMKEIEQREDAVFSLTEQMDKLKLDYSNLKFAKSFSSENVEERDEAKRRLSKLVRDVDKCISILKS